MIASGYFLKRAVNMLAAIQSVGWSILAGIAPLITLALGLLAGPSPADAQQAGKMPRIGFLAALSLNHIADRTEAFHQSLCELGYVEGKNIVLE